MPIKFSVITCTYNSEDYLQNNIKSVENQSFKNFEHIFIDGNSTDKTIAIIKKYQKKYPERIIKLFQSPPKGISNAMNIGIKKASGDYLIHLHSDDSFYNNNILEIVKNFIIQNNGPDWIYGKSKFINENNSFKIIPHRKIYHKIRFWLLLLTNYIPHQSVFLKKTIFQKYGLFDETFKNSMDYDLWLRLSQNKVSSLFIDKVISNFSIRTDAQSNIGKNNSEHIISYKKYLSNVFLIKLLSIIYLIDKKRN